MRPASLITVAADMSGYALTACLHEKVWRASGCDCAPDYTGRHCEKSECLCQLHCSHSMRGQDHSQVSGPGPILSR